MPYGFFITLYNDHIELSVIEMFDEWMSWITTIKDND